MPHRSVRYTLLALLTLTSAPDIARAEPYRWHGEIHRFEEHDLPHWRGGRWYNGWHDGRSGWWWIVGGVWYYYPAPIYPYPDPYRPPTIAPPPPQTWFYCPPANAYYPYIPTCPIPWQPVPAGPR